MAKSVMLTTKLSREDVEKFVSYLATLLQRLGNKTEILVFAANLDHLIYDYGVEDENS